MGPHFGAGGATDFHVERSDHNSDAGGQRDHNDPNVSLEIGPMQ
jgi:hypothetical protein